ncbi:MULTISPECIES: hypothetical protein [unclassified Chryseobacterium]|uniref:hypothetical protein n=1 Tax=unclassified Chryseobacterium TaxID=2593645 RepID=UPI00100A8890|nr:MULTISPECIES: hypothetical protein [unclassified Chryseobacterium]RXM51182.1 hypothetical protein BOQ64_13935 [Chryseobacterium sp. CH25]RXM64792.1 hypothetical protein BOQ60_11320 [Chryseobacterium sp. CH1]
MKLPRKYFLETKMLSYSTLAIIILVIVCVWLSGKGDHRSLFQNSILSTSILAGAFFLFISLGLYYGLKLKDNIGSILNKERIKKYFDKTPEIGSFDFDPPAVGDGIGGAVLSVVVWLLFSILLVFLSYFLGLFFWSAILFLAAMLYWIFFRALRHVFKNSGKCKGNIVKNFGLGFLYSFLYIFWIYGIIFLINYIN